jgi:DNA-directed RNA polymerase beta' subunit
VQRLDSDRSVLWFSILNIKQLNRLKVKSTPKSKDWVFRFDGDEGAVHAAQSEDARREIAGLMSVTCNIMSAQNNTNIAGVVFDALTGSYLLSDPETLVDDLVFMQMRMVMEDDDGFATLKERLDRYYVPEKSGRALLSMLFPPDFWYDKGDVKIREGILTQGRLDSSNIGAAQGSIIQALYKDYGMRRTSNFLTDIYRAAGYYLDTHGFSVGIDDCFLNQDQGGKDPKKVIEYEIQRSKMLVKAMGTKLNDPLEEERREKQIMAYLDTAKNLGVKISKENLSKNNAFNVMAKSGAKGSSYNVALITGIVGQKTIEGQRLPEKGGRTLPYFQPYGEDVEGRGFITRNYLQGLRPADMFLSLYEARPQVANSTVSISVSGDINHRLNKALEDVKVFSDGSVRNNSGVIFQMSYGDASFNLALLETVQTKTGKMPSFINLKRVAGKINSKYGFNK